jgi:hypothetical protein
VLNAGNGFVSYSWSTGAAQNAIVVSTTGTYSVEEATPLAQKEYEEQFKNIFSKKGEEFIKIQKETLNTFWIFNFIDKYWLEILHMFNANYYSYVIKSLLLLKLNSA